MTYLTRRRLLAIQEALIFRLAGEIEDIDDADHTSDDYDKALEWVSDRLARLDAHSA